jgi:hypothetical protein
MHRIFWHWSSIGRRDSKPLLKWMHAVASDHVTRPLLCKEFSLLLGQITRNWHGLAYRIQVDSAKARGLAIGDSKVC